MYLNGNSSKENGHMLSIPPSIKGVGLISGAVWKGQALLMLPALHLMLQGKQNFIEQFAWWFIVKFLGKKYGSRKGPLKGSHKSQIDLLVRNLNNS
jgi:hypothetical protein